MEAQGMTEAYDWENREVVGSDGNKIGKIDEIYVDTASGQPEWASVNTGLFGLKSTFIPLTGSSPDGEDVKVPYTKDEVKDAPGISPDGELSEDEEHQLWDHYGFDYNTTQGTDGGERQPVGNDVSGPETDDAMTRTEEELKVGKTERESGRARLRKYVVTEQVQTTVPVRKEKAVLTTEPITDENRDAATSGADITEEEHEVVLSEEQVVVGKETVAKERVRLGKETETVEEEVSEEVRKEQIDVDGDISR